MGNTYFQSGEGGCQIVDLTLLDKLKKKRKTVKI